MTSLRATTAPIQPVLDGTLARGSDLQSAHKWRQRWVLRCRRKSRKQVLNFSVWVWSKPRRLGGSRDELRLEVSGWPLRRLLFARYPRFVKGAHEKADAIPGHAQAKTSHPGGENNFWGAQWRYRKKVRRNQEHSGDCSGFRGPLAGAGNEFLSCTALRLRIRPRPYWA